MRLQEHFIWKASCLLTSDRHILDVSLTYILNHYILKTSSKCLLDIWQEMSYRRIRWAHQIDVSVMYVFYQGILHSRKGRFWHYHVTAWCQNYLFIPVNRKGTVKKDMHRTVKLTHLNYVLTDSAWSHWSRALVTC